MAVPQQNRPDPPESVASTKKPRNDPQRLQAFARRLNIMLSEMGLPERRRARLIKERVGVSGTTANNWLRGESYPSFEELGRMGRIGMDPARLFPDSDEDARASATELVNASGVSRHLARLIDSAQVTMLRQLKSDDGQWDHTALPNGIWQQILGRGLGGFVVLYMNGDSMGERIKHGTPLLVDTSMTQIADDNSIYALLVNDAVMVRRVQRRLNGGFVIVADNPAIPPETIDQLGSHHDEAAKGRNVLVLGRVALAIQPI